MIEKFISVHNLDKGRFNLLIKNAPFLYKDITVPKKTGGTRNISIPSFELKDIQKKILNYYFYQNIKLPPCVNGGVPRRSIIFHAEPHIKKQYVITMDIKDFFPSIHRSKIENFLPNYFPPDLCEIFIRLTTHNHCLPQGAPTSPFLSNLALLNCDNNIINLCKKNHLFYTRYFDDIAFSGKYGPRFINKISKILTQEGFKINRQKTKIQDKKKDQIITGLIVNKKLDICKSTLSSLNTRINFLKGLSNKHLMYYSFNKEINSLKGYISFMKSVNHSLVDQFEEDLEGILQKFL